MEIDITIQVQAPPTRLKLVAAMAMVAIKVNALLTERWFWTVLRRPAAQLIRWTPEFSNG